MYDILYADPPWDYKGQTQFMGDRPTSSAERHYPTMKLADLKNLDVSSVCADDALIFMWSSSPHLPQALDLLTAWGFAYATIAFVWDKQRVNPGYYTLSQCELCIVGRRGRIPQPRGARNVRQFLSEMRGEHSAKPEEVRRRIEEMFPTQRKLELFARRAVEGWDCWGNEVTSTVTIPQIDT